MESEVDVEDNYGWEDGPNMPKMRAVWNVPLWGAGLDPILRTVSAAPVVHFTVPR